MTSPSVDSSGAGTRNNWSSSSSSTVTVSTSTSNGLCVLVIGYETPGATQPHVTSVTSSHLTFTKYANYAPGSTNKVAVEIWTAPISGTLSSEVITVNTSVNVDDGCIIGFGVNGCYSNAAPFDNNIGLPATNYGIGNPIVTYSTSQADDLLLFTQCGDKATSGGSNPVGWTTVATASNSGAALFCGLGVFVKSVSSAQIIQAVTNPTGAINSDSVALVTAFTADNATLAKARRMVMILD